MPETNETAPRYLFPLPPGKGPSSFLHPLFLFPVAKPTGFQRSEVVVGSPAIGSRRAVRVRAVRVVTVRHYLALSMCFLMARSTAVRCGMIPNPLFPLCAVSTALRISTAQDELVTARICVSYWLNL